jgi:PKD repeat protein
VAGAGGGFLIISGRNVSNAVLEYSSDGGDTWTLVNFGNLGGGYIGSITYGNGIFVALLGALYSVIGVPSGNTINWTLHLRSTFIDPNAIAFDGTNFFAVAPVQGGNPQQSIAYSNNGLDWTFGGNVNGSGIVQLAYGNGVYIAGFGNGILYSNSLSNSFTYSIGTGILTNLVFGSGVFLVTFNNEIYTSTNGVSWTTQSNAPYGISGITYDQNVFMAVNTFSTSVAISANAGVSWTLSDAEHELPNSNTNPLQPQYIGYDRIVADGTGNYLAMLLTREVVPIQGMATAGICPCSAPVTGDYWARFVNVRMRGVSVKRIGTAPPPAPPIANFSATPLNGSAPLTVNFTDTSTNSPTSWQWDFTNNGSVDSTLQNPTYTYNDSGTYTVKLIATNAGGSDTEIKSNYITVSDPPSPIHDLPIQLFGSLTVFYTETTQTLPVNLFGSLTVFYTETTQTLPVNLFGSDGDNLFYTPNTQTLPINLSS